jgi:hypothetical protein
MLHFDGEYEGGMGIASIIIMPIALDSVTGYDIL